MKECLSFDDVQILDDYSLLESRSEVRTSIYGSDNKPLMDLPIFMAAMDTVVTPEAAKYVLEAGGGVVHHRHNSLAERITKLRLTESKTETMNHYMHGIAVGINDDPEEAITMMEDAGGDLLAIELAAANHKKAVEYTLDLIKKRNEVGSNLRIMLGNISSMKNFTDHKKVPSKHILTEVDFIKLSQGGGSACLTREKTGIGKPTFQAVCDADEELNRQCRSRSVGHKASTSWYPSNYEEGERPHIIADGGLRKGADIVKSIAAGASAVMLGSMLAGHDENWCDHYRGMASAEAKRDANMQEKNIEGKSITNSHKGKISDTLTDLRESIQSGIATAGYESVPKFCGSKPFIRVTRAGQVEAMAHGEQ